MDIGKRINDLRLKHKITAVELAERIGVSQSYISLLENNKRRANVEVLGKIAGEFDLTLGQLLADDPNIPAAASKPAEPRVGVNLDSLYKSGQLHAMADARGNVEPVRMRFLPVVSRVAAGDPAVYTDGEYPAGFAEEFVASPVDLEDPLAFALRITGDSMAPRFRDGDIVICSPDRLPENGDAVVAKVNGDETTCKIFYLHGRNVTLSPVNPNYPAQVYPLEEVSWVYPVIFCQRREKR